MRSFILAVLLLASTTMAALAAPRKLAPSTPPTATDVTNSISNWGVSVMTVNAYLNDPTNPTKLASAIIFAKDEPVQLGTLMKTTGLSVDGKDSVKILMANFPSIVGNLEMVQSGIMTTDDATRNINFNRCCTVLPNIARLWATATSATRGVAPVAPPELETQCAMMNCDSGVSGKVVTPPTGAASAVEVTNATGNMEENANNATEIAETTNAKASNVTGAAMVERHRLLRRN